MSDKISNINDIIDDELTLSEIYNIMSVYAIDVALQLDDIDNPFSEAVFDSNLVKSLVDTGFDTPDAVTIGVAGMLFLLFANM